MNKDITIAEAAQEALQSLDRPASIEEIYTEILRLQLYQFNTPTPEHVLRTTIRRHTGNVDRIDSLEMVLFEMPELEIYTLASTTKRTGTKKAGKGMKRIHRASDKEEIIKSLMSDQLGVFREIWKLLLFASQVGMKNGKREPLKLVDTGKGIDQSTFGNCPSWPGLLYLIALAESGRSDCLCGSSEAEEERISVFQEYTNGGLSILKDFFADRPLDLDGLLAFIESQHEEPAGRPDLELTI
jgi:dnd system-associated protein 4